jgi:hypothetical protein
VRQVCAKHNLRASDDVVQTSKKPAGAGFLASWAILGSKEGLGVLWGAVRRVGGSEVF